MNNSFHPLLADAITLMQNQQFKDALQRLTPFLESNDLKLQGQAHSLTAACHSRNKDYHIATLHYERACALNDSYMPWLNIAMTSALEKNISKAHSAFEKAIQKATIEQPSVIPELHFCFANALFESQAYVDALNELNVLWESYCFYHITDRTFLNIRGMVPFDHFINLSFEVLKNLSLKFDGKRWLSTLSGYVDSDGKDYIHGVLFKFKLHEIKQALDPNAKQSFSIPFPIELKNKPVTASLESMHPGNLAYFHVKSGTLDLGANVCIQRNDEIIAVGKVARFQAAPLKKSPDKLSATSGCIIHFEGIDSALLKEGDVLYEKS